MRKPLSPLGETEMEILNHVWELGEASVSDVHDKIIEYRDVAYTTVMTIMKNLSDKEYLKYRQDGRSYIYSAAIQPNDVKFSLIDRLIDKVFKGSPKDLVQTLVQSENLSDEERREIKQLIDKLGDG
jgi:predicted transcriptional regulator